MVFENGFWERRDDVQFVTADQIKKRMEESKKMVEEEQVGSAKKGRYPDFKGKDGSAAWLNKGKQGEYLSVVLADKTRLVLFKEVRGV